MIKSFKLGARKYRVKHGSMDSDCVGTCSSVLGQITIRNHWDGRAIPEDSQEQILYHEVVHAILDEIGQTELNKDETFVQAFSALMYQFAKTAK